jgi:hypothetical protein
MRHHDAPTRLLDWSDGALIALHFALSNKTKDALRDQGTKQRCEPRVYVLGPERLKDCLNRSSENGRHARENWGKYVEKHRPLNTGETGKKSGNTLICPPTKKNARNCPFRSYPWSWIFHISHGVSQPSAADSSCSETIPFGSPRSIRNKTS